MDYAIYKTNDGKHPRIVHRFTQEACNHQAKKAARNKLREMWLHVLDRPAVCRNPGYNNVDDFYYDHATSVATTERIRFYIDKL